MKDTNKYEREGLTKKYKRPTVEENDKDLYYNERNLSPEENIENDYTEIDPYAKERVKNKAKERVYVYRDETDQYDTDEISIIDEEYIDTEEESKGCGSSCGFGCVLILVAIASFIFAGYLVFG